MKKIHRQRYIPGLEWRILKAMPKSSLAGTLIPILMSILVRVLPSDLTGEALLKQHTTIDILSIAIAITAWTAVFTITIGCIVVMVMKGPTYRADSYPLKDSNHPRKKRED